MSDSSTAAVAPVTKTATTYERPAFLDALSVAYSDRGQSVVVFTGNTHDLFYTSKQGRFLELERTLYQALADNFTVLRLDIATGIEFYDDLSLASLQKVINKADGLTLDKTQKVGNLKEQLKETRHSPLPALVLLREIFEAVKNVRRDDQSVKPVCSIIQFSGSLFPAGDFDRLSELDRQRLVTFLNMIESPWFKASSHLVLLVADTKTEINQRIVSLPSVQCIEIGLPTACERQLYVDAFMQEQTKQNKPSSSFEKDSAHFVADSAGLQLTALQDLLETSSRSATAISRKQILAEINTVMQADLGDIIKLSRPEHKPSDIVGYAKTGEIFLDIFRRCEDPKTAVPAILVSGPNGSGKTFQLEAYASESGRVVIELAGLRGMYFGQTDAFFEKLRLRIKTYGKILILVDEAHTAFGSVHKGDTHETEKRLSGNIIKMMGDRTLFGKVLWGLMTSRPDELDPDVKSRAPIQIPIFDLEGTEREAFVRQFFAKRGAPISDEDFAEVLKITANYSNRDYDFLVKEVLGSGGKTVLETLKFWQASSSIKRQRRLQTFIAAQHCSYPDLLPSELKDVVGSEEFEQVVAKLKHELHH